jgi:hypothetical protein
LSIAKKEDNNKMALKGLKEIQEKSAEAEELANQNRIKYLGLRDGESANIRFIDDDEMLQTKIHEYEEVTPDGIRYRKAYCLNHLMGAPCKWCASGTTIRNVYVFLVYVYDIIHKAQNPKLADNSNAQKWALVKQGGQNLYREDVKEVRVLRLKWGKDNNVKNAILQFANVYGTLCDRNYVFLRTGAAKDTSYSFVPKDPSPTPDEVIAAKKETPHIDEVIIGNRAKTATSSNDAAPLLKTDATSGNSNSEDDLF